MWGGDLLDLVVSDRDGLPGEGGEMINQVAEASCGNLQMPIESPQVGALPVIPTGSPHMKRNSAVHVTADRPVADSHEGFEPLLVGGGKARFRPPPLTKLTSRA